MVGGKKGTLPLGVPFFGDGKGVPMGWILLGGVLAVLRISEDVRVRNFQAGLFAGRGCFESCQWQGCLTADSPLLGSIKLRRSQTDGGRGSRLGGITSK